MCTAFSVSTGDGYFGRNLDFETDFGEKIVVVPRGYRFSFSSEEESAKHYAMIGMAVVSMDYPLFFDAVNETGLAIAGLRFSENAVYKKAEAKKHNVASYELIPWILSRCASVREAKVLLENTVITDDAFSKELSPSPLHWIIADKAETITLEQTESGIFIYDNPVGVLTNNPAFLMHIENLNSYINLTAQEPKNRFFEGLNQAPHSRGLGAFGLPGDFSSMSRFIKTSFICGNSVFSDVENEVVNHLFHTLYAVYQQRGCVRVGDGYEITNYSSCFNLSKGIYYYTTYSNSNINAVDMKKENLESDRLLEFELIKNMRINIQN